MSETQPFAYCDQLVEQFEAVIRSPIRKQSSFYYTGVDLGTACVVLSVLDETGQPVAGAYRYADVVRDGMVVDGHDKVSSIINRHVAGHEVKELYLVGGTCCLSGMKAIIERKTGIATYKPGNPMFVTPLGIALNCTQEAI